MLSLAALLVAGCSVGRENPAPSERLEPTVPPAFEIGAVLPLTGPLAPYGLAVRDGLRLAFETRSDGRADLVVLDSKGTPESTREALRTLAARPAVRGAVGPCSSGNADAAAEEAETLGLPLVIPTATAFALTRGRAFVFRVCFTDPLQGAAMAIFARRRLRLASAAIVSVPGDAYSESLTEAFHRAFTGMGGEIPVAARFGPGGDPLDAARAVVQARPRPGAVFVPAYFEEAARFAREVRRLGYEGVLLGGDGWHGERFLEIVGEDAGDAYFISHFIAQAPGRETRAFVSAFRERLGREPGPFAALGYDAGLVCLRAVPVSGRVDRKAFRKELAAVVGVEGATGEIALDEAGNTLKDAIVVRVRDGAFRFEERLRFTPGLR